MGMLLHRTLMEQAEKGKGKTTKVENILPKVDETPKAEKQEDKAKKPTKSKKE